MASIAYLSVGTNDFDRACAFYDQLLAPLGGKRLFPTQAGLMFSVGKGPMLMVARPANGEPATFGNGSMIAIQVDTKEQVTELHTQCLALGGTCEGPPGPRGEWGEFAYMRDLDGNKLAFFHPAG